MTVLLDTHAWVWACDAPERLGAHARRAILGAQRRMVSVVSAWEIGMLVAHNRLHLATSVDSWIARSVEQSGLVLLDLGLACALESARLPAPVHRDPVDRFLIATARLLDAVLVTADKDIRAYHHVKTAW